MAYERQTKAGVAIATTIYLEKPLNEAVAAAAVREGRGKAPFIAHLLRRRFLKLIPRKL